MAVNPDSTDFAQLNRGRIEDPCLRHTAKRELPHWLTFGVAMASPQNSTKRNKFHADNEINYANVMRHKEHNYKNSNSPYAMRKAPMLIRSEVMF